MPVSLSLRERIPYVGLFGLAIAFGLACGVSPQVGVAAALGLAFVVLVFGNLLAGVCLFTVLAFFALLPTFGGSAFSFAKVTGLLIAIAWFASASNRNERRREFVSVHPVISYVIVAFLAYVAISLLWSEDRSGALTALSRYALNAFLFVIVYAAVRKRQHLLAVVIAFVAGATIAGAYGLVVPPANVGEATARVTGTLGDPNELAAQMVAGMALALALAMMARGRPLLRFAAIGSAGVCALSLLLTLSRGGLIALGVAVVAMILFGGRWRIPAAIAAGVVALATIGYFTYFASPVAKQRVTTVQGGSGRSDIWTVGWRMVKAHPVNGVGAGNFQTSSIHYVLAPGVLTRTDLIIVTPEVAHNTYLNVLADLGIVGLTMFLAVIAFSLACMFKAIRIFTRLGNWRLELLSRGLLVSLVGLLAADFFISEMYSKQLWLMLALSAPLLAIARREQANDPEHAQERVRSRAERRHRRLVAARATAAARYGSPVSR